jgi:multidrug resistance efflux pump
LSSFGGGGLIYTPTRQQKMPVSQAWIIPSAPFQSGKILQVAVDDGAVVKKGDLLFVLDDVMLQIEKEKASAGLDHANDEVKLQKIRLDLAKEDLNRAEQQFAGGVISQEAMSRVKKNYEMMEASFNRSIH